jgi:hypothetical protein
MLVLASFSIGAVPFPSVLIFLGGLQKELTHDFRSGSFHHFLFFFAQDLSQIIFREGTELLASNGVHDKLGSLIDVKIDFFVSVEGEIMGVNTFFAFLANSLLEVRTDSVSWVIFILVVTIGTA